jgi:hypothetical protein
MRYQAIEQREQVNQLRISNARDGAKGKQVFSEAGFGDQVDVGDLEGTTLSTSRLDGFARCFASFASTTDCALRGASSSFLTLESRASPDRLRKAFFTFTA